MGSGSGKNSYGSKTLLIYTLVNMLVIGPCEFAVPQAVENAKAKNALQNFRKGL
jgi:hypothetical protein